MLICRETEREFELFVPHRLIADGAVRLVDERVLSEFRPNSFGVVGARRANADDPWRRCDEASLLDGMHNAPPTWLCAWLNDAVHSSKVER